MKEEKTKEFKSLFKDIAYKIINSYIENDKSNLLEIFIKIKNLKLEEYSYY